MRECLLAYASWHGRLHRTQGGKDSGGSQAQHLRVLAKSKNPKVRERARRELEGPEVPSHFRYLWRWLMDADMGLLNGASVSQLGLHVTWRDVVAWQELFGIHLAPFEVSLMVSMANTWIAARSPQVA